MNFTTTELMAKGYNPDGTRIGSQPATVSKSVERERDLHDAILTYCSAKGWPIVHSRMDVPATCGVGTPDFAIAAPGGRTLWIECKARDCKLRPEQAAWMAALVRFGHIASVVRSMEEFLALVERHVTK